MHFLHGSIEEFRDCAGAALGYLWINKRNATHLGA